MVYQYQPFMDRCFWMVDPFVLPTFEVILCPTSRVADADVRLYTGMPHFTLEPSSAWPWWPCDFMGYQWGYLMGYDMRIWLWLWPNYYIQLHRIWMCLEVRNTHLFWQFSGKQILINCWVLYFNTIHITDDEHSCVSKPWYPGEHQHNW
jgi:hypothetical protein